jgi:hypothetical protein
MGSKKSAGKDKPKTQPQKEERKEKESRELSDDQLEHVAGGSTVDLPAVQLKAGFKYLKIDY